jgi:hypothetical protein
MKKEILIFLFIVFSLPVLTAQNNQVKNNPVGSWKFEALYAPEGYTSGTIVVGLNGKKPTAKMSITGSDSILFGENVKTVNDSVLFSVFIQAQDVKVMLKVENDTLMSGKAVYSEGEVPLTLTKILNPESEAKH